LFLNEVFVWEDVFDSFLAGGNINALKLSELNFKKN